MENIKETVRQNLIRLRKSKKLTQIELSQKIGYSDKAISRWETGEVTPDVETLSALADIYGVPVSVFFLENSEEFRERTEKKYIGRNLAAALLVIACLWYLVIIVFMRLEAIGVARPWLMFIWACPATFLLAMLFNMRCGPRIMTFVFCSLLCWTLILSFYLQFLEYNMYLLFPSGAPLQAVIVLWAFVKQPKKDGNDRGGEKL